MKKFVLYTLILMAPFCFVVLLQAQEINLPKTIQGKVVSVESGNLLTVRENKIKYVIKLVGINVPTQSYKKESRENLSKLAKDQDAVFTVLASAKDRDNNVILIAKAVVKDQDLAFEQIKAGLAWNSKEIPAEDKLGHQLAQKTAKEKKLGIWSDNFEVCKIEASKQVVQPAQKPSENTETVTDGLVGSVLVEVLISEKGEILSAKALCGQPLLQTLAVESALKLKFKGQGYRISGNIVYNFVA